MAKVPSGIVKQFKQQRMLVKELEIDGVEMVANNRENPVRYVHSGNGAAANLGLVPSSPVNSIENALTLCEGSAGDVIVCMPGHVETVSAAAGLDLDVAGVTVYFLGEGANRAKITFTTDVAADMDIDAANITLVNPLFVAGIDALTGPIDVNAADFTIINGEARDAAGIAATDWLVADANADRLRILGWTFVDSTTGTQKQSNIQVAGADDIVIKDFNIVGDFGTGAIENGTAWVNATLENGVINNLSASPTVGVLLQATSTGSMRNVHIRVASGTTYLTANNDMQFFECFGTGTDATAGEKIGTILSGDIEGKIDLIVAQQDSLDGTTPAYFFPGLGYRVTKIGDVSTSIDQLFAVTGKCLITLMHGEVTSVIATTTSLQLTTSTNSIIICASTDIITDVVGTLYMVTGDYDDVLNGAQVPQADIAMTKTGTMAPFIVNDDGLTQSINGAGTGLIEWSVYYIPLEASAAVASVA